MAARLRGLSLTGTALPAAPNANCVVVDTDVSASASGTVTINATDFLTGTGGVGTLNTFTVSGAGWTAHQFIDWTLVDHTGKGWAISDNTTTALTVTGTPPSGTWTISAMAIGDSVTVNSQAVTIVATSPGANQFQIGAGANPTAVNMAAALNASSGLAGLVTATSATNVVTITAVQAGVVGNSITLSVTITNSGSMAASGSYLAGGTPPSLYYSDGASWLPFSSLATGSMTYYGQWTGSVAYPQGAVVATSQPGWGINLFVAMSANTNQEPTDANNNYWAPFYEGAMIFKGAYSNTYTYNYGDVVTSGGNVYTCISGTVGSEPPGASWQLISGSGGSSGTVPDGLIWPFQDSNGRQPLQVVPEYSNANIAGGLTPSPGELYLLPFIWKGTPKSFAFAVGFNIFTGSGVNDQAWAGIYDTSGGDGDQAGSLPGTLLTSVEFSIENPSSGGLTYAQFQQTPALTIGGLYWLALLVPHATTSANFCPSSTNNSTEGFLGAYDNGTGGVALIDGVSIPGTLTTLPSTAPDVSAVSVNFLGRASLPWAAIQTDTT